MFRDHWDTFYAAAHPDLEEPTSFARFCLHRMAPGSTVFELGCGNGRDALYFARHGLQVIACDQSAVAISAVTARAERAGPFPAQPIFLRTEFRQLGAVDPVDVVYSRFTLHAVDADEASHALGWAMTALRPGGKLMIEARSVKGSLYGVGTPAGRDAFIADDHFRRFLRRDEVETELRHLGFEIAESTEGSGLAVHGTDDPVVIRIVAGKP